MDVWVMLLGSAGLSQSDHWVWVGRRGHQEKIYIFTNIRYKDFFYIHLYRVHLALLEITKNIYKHGK